MLYEFLVNIHTQVCFMHERIEISLCGIMSLNIYVEIFKSSMNFPKILEFHRK